MSTWLQWVNQDGGTVKDLWPSFRCEGVGWSYNFPICLGSRFGIQYPPCLHQMPICFSAEQILPEEKRWAAIGLLMMPCLSSSSG